MSCSDVTSLLNVKVSVDVMATMNVTSKESAAVGEDDDADDKSNKLCESGGVMRFSFGIL